MASTKRARRGIAPPAPATPESAPIAPPGGGRFAPALSLGGTAIAVFAWLATLRLGAPQPWSYDEYYHLVLARSFPLHRFPWTPFSIFADAFADKEPLFHLLLAPFASWPLTRAAAAGVLLGQAALVAAMAFALVRLAAPRAWLWLAALPGLGTQLLGRSEMLRPHIWLIAFTVVTLAALATATPWWALAVLAALFGLVHTGGWIAVPLALVACLLAWRDGAPPRRLATWRPWLATTAGWLAGQLLHPNFPANFRLAWIQNVVVVFQSAGGDEALRSQLGAELLPPSAALLRNQWPVFLLTAALVAALLVEPAARRSRAVLLFAAPGLAALLAGTLVMQRFFELGGPLLLLALAAVAAQSERSPRPLARRFAVLLGAAVFVLVTALAMRSIAADTTAGKISPPDGMARFLGQTGKEKERVFTAQWADSAPLLYHAPQLESLVALDPTFFFVKDPVRFRDYVRIVQGTHENPATAIREEFGARWVSVWKAPVYERLARQLVAVPGATIAFSDRDYLVFDLAGVAKP
ncbi:MAG: hypothetical protein IPJ17_19725 [Holophagales bacterium]|nr:MAG: hypothetical protein IPJ17_19725 [Holophagales bacterium]